MNTELYIFFPIGTTYEDALTWAFDRNLFAIYQGKTYFNPSLLNIMWGPGNVACMGFYAN